MKILDGLLGVFFIMSGVVYNESTDRYLEPGQMINHDIVFLNTAITQNYIAETSDVTMLKFSREIFKEIVESFSDIYDDMKKVVADRRAH